MHKYWYILSDVKNRVDPNYAMPWKIRSYCLLKDNTIIFTSNSLNGEKDNFHQHKGEEYFFDFVGRGIHRLPNGELAAERWVEARIKKSAVISIKEINQYGKDH